MPTTLTNGIQLPDKGSVDWYNSMQSNYNLIDTHLGDTDVHVTAEDKANWNSKQGSLSQAQLDAIAQVATNTSDIATLQSGKADASHTHSSSDITDIGDYATKQYVDNSISGLVDNAPAALDTLKELSTALNDDANFASTVTTALAAKVDSADLATVATSGSYTDLDDKPTINDSTITIQKNGSTVDTFTTNGSAKTIDIPVPTKTSDLTNDSNFVDTSNSAVASGITSAKVTDYDTHIADTDIHVTTADKATWNTVTSKANDSDVVHTSGNETISGEKTFDAGQINVKSTIQEIGVIPQTSTLQYMPFMDKNNVIHGLVGLWDYDNGASEIQLNISDIFKNGVKDKTGTLDTSFFSFGFLSTGVKFTTFGGQLNNSLIPLVNSTYDVGSSSYKWKSVYATNYYYGSSNVEFSTKFVTTDTNQTISGDKTFSGNISIYNSDTSVDAKYLIFKNQKVKRGSTTETGTQFITFQDKDSGTLVSYEANVSVSGNTQAYINVSNLDANSQRVIGGVKVIKTPTETWFTPDGDNTISLGLSNYKWKDVQTKLINGLTPSSLSLPDLSNAVDISGYITDLAGLPNVYSPPANGYIVLRSTTANVLGIVENTTGMGSYSRGSNQVLAVNLPVVKNSSVSIYAICTSLTHAKFIPCQGNI